MLVFRACATCEKFQSTQPEWAATAIPMVLRCACFYFNPRSPSGLRRFRHLRKVRVQCHFNPRSPSGLRQEAGVGVFGPGRYFNPRSPSGLRFEFDTIKILLADFNPRSPSGLRRQSDNSLNLSQSISIHAARVGCDRKRQAGAPILHYFNPRSPSGLRQRIC